jgi:hypothetical protein
MKHLSSSELLSRAKSLVAEERRAQVALIEHLEEIQRRRLYAELGYTSLWDFATRYLGLSEGAAQRRIQAMRLVREVPEAKAAIETGALSLSNAAKVQSFRQNERKLGRPSDAQALVEQVQGLSQRECEQRLFEISPEALPRERERIVSAEAERELKVVVSAALYDKLQRIRGLIAHAKPDASYAELLECMAETTIAALERKKGVRGWNEGGGAPSSSLRGNAVGDAVGDTALGSVGDADDSSAPVAATAASTAPATPVAAATTADPVSTATAAAAVEARARALPAGKRVALPAAVKRVVWFRGGGRCEVEVNGQRCSSRYRLEIDHIAPLAQGGSHELSNMRLACWHHNQQQAVAKLGA